MPRNGGCNTRLHNIIVLFDVRESTQDMYVTFAQRKGEKVQSMLYEMRNYSSKT